MVKMIRRLLVVALFFFPVFQASSQNLDIDILKSINSSYTKNFPFWRDITNSAYIVPATYTVSNLAVGIIHHDKQARKFGLESVISVGVATILSQGLKSVIMRDRPAMKYPDIIHTYSMTNSSSFPSGHSSTAFATATTMAYQSGKWYVALPAFSWAGAVGYSRMRLGKHYPSDVLVGTLIGIGSGMVGHWLTNKIVK